MSDVAALAATQYVSLTSFRRDGTPVSTPIWVCGYGSGLAVWTVRTSFKVKRIGRNPAVTVAPCKLRGEVTGEAVSGRATILSDEDTAKLRKMMARKYGLMGWFTVYGSVVRRGKTGTIGIHIDLD